jgi:hypothetical protein
MILSGQRNPTSKIRRKLSSLGVVNFRRENSLRGRCPRPLDECAAQKAYQRNESKYLSSLSRRSGKLKSYSRLRALFNRLPLMRHLSNRGMTTAAVITAISQSGTRREKLAVRDLSLPALM